MTQQLTKPISVVLADDHLIVREGLAAFCETRPELSTAPDHYTRQSPHDCSPRFLEAAHASNCTNPLPQTSARPGTRRICPCPRERRPYGVHETRHREARVVPRYNPLPVFIVKNVLRTARISRERYLELLEQS